MSPFLSDAVTGERISRRLALQRAGIGALGVAGLGSLLAACGDDSDSSTTAGGSATGTATATPTAPQASGTLDYFGWEGEDLKEIMKDWLAENDVTYKTTFMATLEDPIQKLQGGSSGVDILDFTNVAVPRYVQLDLLEPLDESKLPNLANLLPRWAGEDPSWTNADGQRVFIPLFFQTPGINYDTDQLDEAPKRWQDLLEPSFKNKIGVWAEPNALFGLATEILGLPMGDVPKAELGKINDLTARFIDQARSVAATYGDLANQLKAGDIMAAYAGFPLVEAIAAGSGATNVKTNIRPEDGNFSFLDGYAIPKGADNTDAAYAFLNETLTPEVNSQAAAATAGGTVVTGAAAMVSQEATFYPEDQTDAVLQNAPQQILPPLESDEFITQGEWLEKFTALTS